MAIVYSIDPKSRRDLGVVNGTITLDGSYAAGGYALTNSSLGMLDNPDNLNMQYVHATATSDFVPVYDKANNKVKIFKSGTAGATLNECVSGDITASHSILFEARGRPAL